MEIWIAGTSLGYSEWSFIGAFDSEEKAAKSCETEMDFIAPCVLNQAFENQLEIWEGAYYPFEGKS